MHTCQSYSQAYNYSLQRLDWSIATGSTDLLQKRKAHFQQLACTIASEAFGGHMTQARHVSRLES